jgi:hypothetical protein
MSRTAVVVIDMIDPYDHADADELVGVRPPDVDLNMGAEICPAEKVVS